MLPATRQRPQSRSYPSRSWYSIKQPWRDARLSWHKCHCHKRLDAVTAHTAQCRVCCHGTVLLTDLEAEFWLTDELVCSADDLRLAVVDGADICINNLNIHAGDDVVAHARAWRRRPWSQLIKSHTTRMRSIVFNTGHITARSIGLVSLCLSHVSLSHIFWMLMWSLWHVLQVTQKGQHWMWPECILALLSVGQYTRLFTSLLLQSYFMLGWLPQKWITGDNWSRLLNTHTYTHPFNGPLSGTTQVSRYQKGKTNLDFTEARDSEWQWHQLGHMQICTSLQTNNHASTPPFSFLQARCPSCRPTNSVKALKAGGTSTKISHAASTKVNYTPGARFTKYLTSILR